MECYCRDCRAAGERAAWAWVAVLLILGFALGLIAWALADDLARQKQTRGIQPGDQSRPTARSPR